MSSSIPQENSIQERQCIISQAAARGLQLSEDGRIWVPINSESSNHPLNQSNVKTVKKLPSDISLNDSNVIIVKNGSQLSNSDATGITILYLFLALMPILCVIFVIFLARLFWDISGLSCYGGGC